MTPEQAVDRDGIQPRDNGGVQLSNNPSVDVDAEKCVMVNRKRTHYFKQLSGSCVSQSPSGFCTPGKSEAGMHCRT